jgi:epoxyqueuosine reductase QueG
MTEYQFQLIQEMEHFIAHQALNRLPSGQMIYAAPLVGFAQAEDPLFQEFKKDHIIGPRHPEPGQWLAGAQTVISYFLPFTDHIRLSNHPPGPASAEWLQGRFQGEALNNEMRKWLVAKLEQAGEKAVAPVLDKTWQADYEKFTSNWSERHVAHVAGLGTFSLNRGLITSRGMAGRFGSIVTSLALPPTPRTYTQAFAYCPYLQDGSCGTCIDRCPSGAITSQGKDKKRCHQYIFIEDPLASLRAGFGYPTSSCGKCQTAVPCERAIP